MTYALLNFLGFILMGLIAVHFAFPRCRRGRCILHLSNGHVGVGSMSTER